MPRRRRLLSALQFFPRGGSSHVARALARELPSHGWNVTVVSGSRTDLDAFGDAARFYAGLDVHPGAHAVAAWTLERAARLSPAPGQRGGRLLGAASEYQLAGQSDRAVALLQEARENVQDSLSLAELDHLRGRVLMTRGPLALAHEILTDAAHAIQGRNAAKAAAMLSDASLACFIAGRATIAEALSRQEFARVTVARRTSIAVAWLRAGLVVAWPTR